MAQEEGHILVTMNRNIMRRRLIASGKLRAILLESERLEEQLRQIVMTASSTRSGISLCA